MLKYQNGNCSVCIEDDGTKTRKTPRSIPSRLIFPESINLKITNRCDLKCPFCCEEQGAGGAHAPAVEIRQALFGVPAGVEVTLSGGNPLCHPDVESIIRMFNSRGLITNISVNELHLGPIRNRKRLQDLIDEGSLQGIGVSISPTWQKPTFGLDTNNLVAHVIVGVHSFETISAIRKCYKKVLISGYKFTGPGKNFYSRREEHESQHLKKNMWKFFYRKYGEGIISFDSLAIEQLEVWKHLSTENWLEFYMGDDGEFSCYYDVVAHCIKETLISPKGIYFVDVLEGFSLLMDLRKNKEQERALALGAY